MLIFKEKIDLPLFRKERLLLTMQQTVPGIQGIAVDAYYLVEIAKQVDVAKLVGATKQVDVVKRVEAAAQVKLVATVDVQHVADVLRANLIERVELQENTCLVTPRIGTISPWCTKATDILRQSGLSAIKRVEKVWSFQLKSKETLTAQAWERLSPQLHDRMTQSFLLNPDELTAVMQQGEPQPDHPIPVLSEGIKALQEADQQLGLALSLDELNYLVTSFQQMQRDPTAAELMMFAQANSEHCRHKVFNASWTIDGETKSQSLFSMIKETHKQSPDNVLSAYKDNAAVLAGSQADYFYANNEYHYQFTKEPIHTVLKVETHNHPTGISPNPGAATGIGGEIRDEAATGRGAKSVAGLTGFCVSDLQIPGFPQPWEDPKMTKPNHMASALDIMLEAPIGGAAFSNEFGRPNLCGYFRTFYQTNTENKARGYHKPLMLAGGMGHIREAQVTKKNTTPDALVIVLGGPAMLIGLGGGAASSMHASSGKEQLDFASVQRGNPEMQRRCQEVINACCALGDANPIVAIHDVGAGGIANAIPEILHDSERGGMLELRHVPNDQPDMTPMAIWCNESQERYVLTIQAERLADLQSMAERERCPLAVVGKATDEPQLKMHDDYFNHYPIDVSMDWLFGHPPKMHRDSQHRAPDTSPFNSNTIDLQEALERLLQVPAVASKSFLITIGDRSITGLVARDQMVGPWQVPVADVAVSARDYNGYTGSAMAMGERPTLALIDSRASVSMALGEVITNIVAAGLTQIKDIRCSANWMAAVKEPGEDAALYDAVEQLSTLCQRLDICIPVGKDSLSMQTQWQEGAQTKKVVSPVTLNLTASAPVEDIRRVLTPQLQNVPSQLLFIDLAQGQQRLGGSCLAQVYQQLGDACPNIDDPTVLRNFVKAMAACQQENTVLAYHDRSDGGLWATICEMSFAGHCGFTVDIAALGNDPLAILMNEELGAVIQVADDQLQHVQQIFSHCGFGDDIYVLGAVTPDDLLIITHQEQTITQQPRVYYQKLWAATSYHMQRLRDNPECADQEYAQLDQTDDQGLHAHITFDYPTQAPAFKTKVKPKVAILREQGVNGHVEMAAAFSLAGFTAIDVHMQDLLNGKVNLNEFVSVVACGGFSYGDVLGAGRGWASAIQYHEAVRDQFQMFWQRQDTFTLGVCNGCQMLSQLKTMIPGCEHWPEFVTNQSEQFEARLVMTEVLESPSIFFKGMQGTRLPITVAHGEGRVLFTGAAEDSTSSNVIPGRGSSARGGGTIVMQYVDHQGRATAQYPMNCG